MNVDWELQKKVIGLRLIEVKHSSENITERVPAVVEEFGLIMLRRITLVLLLIL